MPTWVNINDRFPVLQRNYYVKHGLTKDILPLDRIKTFSGYADDFFWLDETDLIENTISKMKMVKSIEDFDKLKHEDVSAANTYIHSVKEAGKKPMFINKAIDVINALNDKYEVTAIANLSKIFGVKTGLKFERKLFEIKQQNIKLQAKKIKP